MSKIMVVGSISTDFIVTTRKRPAIGETVQGEAYRTSFGGKGANQAVAASKLGAEVQMVGTVGEDHFGDLLLQNLEENGIHIENVERVTHVESGSAHITLIDGDNSIIFIPGANEAFDESRLQDIEENMKQVDFVLLQNEVPISIVKRVIDLSNRLNVKTIYNPAPAQPIEQKTIDQVTFLTPNESEFKTIFPSLSLNEGLKKYPNKLIVTLGSKGAVYANNEGIVTVPAYDVPVVDTTGAGDTFNGALAYALSKELNIKHSVQFANLAAALSIQKFGAQGGSPTLNEMKESRYYEEAWNLE